MSEGRAVRGWEGLRDDRDGRCMDYVLERERKEVTERDWE